VVSKKLPGVQKEEKMARRLTRHFPCWWKS